MSAKKSSFIHPKFGQIVIVRNARARRIILRARPDAIYITLPIAAGKQEADDALLKYGEKLQQQRANISKHIDFNYSIEAPLFKLSLSPVEDNRFFLRKQGKIHTLLCPSDTNFNDSNRQQWLQKSIINCLKKCAAEYLPQRLQELSAERGFKFNRASTRECRTRWGSCSSSGNISLSIYLMLLPEELIDYVILHELCHTKEMNHSSRFWQLLDSVTNGEAKELRNKLKKYKTSI